MVLLFFDSSDGGVACGHVLLGHGEEVAEGRDVAEHADVEGFAAHGFEDLGWYVRLRGLDGGDCHWGGVLTASHSGVLSLSERQSLISAMSIAGFLYEVCRCCRIASRL